jgi:hypothetical protein
MFSRIAHLLGFRKKDEALHSRFAQIKARYGCSSREDVDLLNHVRSELNAPYVVGAAPQTMEEVRQSFLDTYSKSIVDAEKPELVAGKN